MGNPPWRQGTVVARWQCGGVGDTSARRRRGVGAMEAAEGDVPRAPAPLTLQ